MKATYDPSNDKCTIQLSCNDFAYVESLIAAGLAVVTSSDEDAAMVWHRTAWCPVIQGMLDSVPQSRKASLAENKAYNAFMEEVVSPFGMHFVEKGK